MSPGLKEPTPSAAATPPPLAVVPPRTDGVTSAEGVLKLLARAIRQFHTYPATSPICVEAITACQDALKTLPHRDRLMFRVTPQDLIVDESTIGAGTLMLGKALYTAVLALFSLLVLALVGAAVLRRGVDPAGFLLLSLALVLGVTGTSAAVYGLARDERRGATISSIIYLVLAFAGGSFVNFEGLPRAVRAVAPASPFYWGTSGYRQLIESAATASDILPNAAVLAGLGTGLLALGVFLLHRGLRRGGLA